MCPKAIQQLEPNMYRLHPQQLSAPTLTNTSANNIFNLKLWKPNASAQYSNSRHNHSNNHRYLKRSLVYFKWMLAIVMLLATLAAILYFLTIGITDTDDSTPLRSPAPSSIHSTTARSFPSHAVFDESPSDKYYDDEVADRDGSISGRLAIFVQTDEPPPIDVHLTDDWFDLNEQLEDDRRFEATAKQASLATNNSFQPQLMLNVAKEDHRVFQYPKPIQILHMRPINVVDESYQLPDEDKPVEQPTSKSTRLFPAIYPITSAHQNSFGVPIEQDQQRIYTSKRNNSDSDYVSTTASNFNSATRVSPTLPNFNRPTDSKHLRPTQEGIVYIIFNLNTNLDLLLNCGSTVQCRSTSLPICRGVLQYDLTSIYNRHSLTTLDMQHFEWFVQSNCSASAQTFLCAVLEPECRPSEMGTLLPCQSTCKGN